MSVDWTKPIQTDIGYKAEYLCEYHFRNGKTRIVIIDTGEHSFPESFYENGGGSSMNIINVPPRKETREVVAWAVTNKAGGVWSVLLTEAAARHSASHCCAPEESHVIRLTGTYEAEVAE